ncbi:hypothetical protein ROS62_03305 [Streptomyces sp. DSM 41972]|uniref:Uncharacterized protein n=1 Tax=Streptomyces althioticus subsp. attaecolombicae TaxID=3075534 RepID=A0ABU3HTD9_9ACTN|nr:hypothetical protein [Streptomyces sp. DSM 41972]SCE01233.1 hypothetical protein GA0115238_142212 [Streptomyces sp. di50b]SCE19230.1 hypothetical protein GA0115245_125213 [Streptomyces sp. di188]
MEQRIGSSSSKPLEGAGFDPAFIPGLTAPVTGREEEAEDTKGAPGADEDVAVDDTATVAAADEAEETGEPEDSPAAEADEESGADEEPEPAPEGPVFEASDRRAALVADHRGVRLKLDDQECEFRWDEIGAVETETARFGKRYTVTVHTPDRRWYPLEIDADSRRRFAEWDAALDKVLDAYFDDGAEAAADSGDARDESEDKAESADKAEDRAEAGSEDKAEAAERG